jgi:hypothetical protein
MLIDKAVDRNISSKKLWKQVIILSLNLCQFCNNELFYSGRADIVKRLKYTKDIMYRLINMQA